MKKLTMFFVLSILSLFLMWTLSGTIRYGSDIVNKHLDVEATFRYLIPGDEDEKDKVTMSMTFMDLLNSLNKLWFTEGDTLMPGSTNKLSTFDDLMNYLKMTFLGFDELLKLFTPTGYMVLDTIRGVIKFIFYPVFY